MTQELVNLGGQPNDGQGDSIRDAFGKVNTNFAEVYADIALIQDFIGSNTDITLAVSEIQAFSTTIANFSATQALFQGDLNTVTGNILTNNSNYQLKSAALGSWTNLISIIQGVQTGGNSGLSTLTTTVTNLIATVSSNFNTLTNAISLSTASVTANLSTLGTTVSNLNTTVGNLNTTVGNNYTTLTNLISASTASAISYSVPVGIISLWYGAATEIPAGWGLCDGSVYFGKTTPDLRNVFVRGADPTGANIVGSTGGFTDTTVVSHSHSAISTVTESPHSHTYRSTANPNGSGSPSGTDTTPGESTTVYTGTTDGESTGITVSTTVSSAGTSGNGKNLPPFYSLCYIMRVK